MGEVWLARHRTLNETVALKLLSTPPQLGEVEDADVAAARFRLEAQVAARLSRRSRHIVRVTDHGEEGVLAYLVMEHLEGQTLEAHLMRRGRMPPARVGLLVAQIARGLEQAHSEGVVHRDLKPANIFLAQDEDGGLLVKLLDFGIARLMGVHRGSGFSTAPNVIFGTPGYMSPEHAYAVAQPDHHYDLWALATVAYEALTEELPVSGVSPGELLESLHARRFVPIHERAPDLPRGLAVFFARAFSERVGDRYASASDLAQAFGHAVSAGDQAAIARGGQGASRTRVQVAAVVTVLAIGLGATRMLKGQDKPLANAIRAEMPGEHSRTVAPFGPPAQGIDEPLFAASPALSIPAPAGPAAPESAHGPATSAPPIASTPPSPPAGAAGPSIPGCDPPFEIDLHGIKRWKRRCL